MKTFTRAARAVTSAFIAACVSIAGLALPALAQDGSDGGCFEDGGEIEQLTVRILEGATQAEIAEAFSELGYLSEDAARSASGAYIAQLGGGSQPSRVSLTVNDLSNCVRLVVI